MLLESAKHPEGLDSVPCGAEQLILTLLSSTNRLLCAKDCAGRVLYHVRGTGAESKAERLRVTYVLL